jgi:hypothetical protein
MVLFGLELVLGFLTGMDCCVSCRFHVWRGGVEVYSTFVLGD